MIRPATIHDVPVLHSMLRAAAEEQGGLEHFCVDQAALREDGFGPAPRFQVILSEVDGEPVGVALYFFNYSTWTSRNGLYLEDLYVKPRFRSRGVARALMQHLARIAVERGCGRFDWLVLRDNVRAIRFYETLGAEAPEAMLMRLAGDALRHLAQELRTET